MSLMILMDELLHDVLVLADDETLQCETLATSCFIS